MAGDSSNLDVILQYLTARGLTPAQAAGVAGNLQIESGFNPNAYNASEGAIGIAQWEGGRRTALNNYAAATGGSPTSLTTQLGFLWNELTGTESSALTALKATTTPTQAASVFDQTFERSAGTSRTARQNAAASIYAGGVPDSNGSDTPDTIIPSGVNGTGVAQAQPADFFGIGASITNTLYIGLGVLGGLALVAVGLAQAARPAARRAKETVQSIAASTPIPV